MTIRRPSVLRSARREKGLSVERAAVAAGISGGWLRLVERDPSLLTTRVAERLSPVIGISVADLLAAAERQP